MTSERSLTPFQKKLYRIIFEADTPAGKQFDVWLLVMILASVLTVFLESTPSIAQEYRPVFKVLEWIFTVFFTIEYVLRIYCSLRPVTYVRSFYGLLICYRFFPRTLVCSYPVRK